MRYVCSFFLLISSPFSPLFAEETGSISGVIRCEQCNNFTGMYVELSMESGGFQMPMQVDIGGDGLFNIASVPLGTYRLHVVNQRGQTVKDSVVMVHGLNTNITLDLNTPKSQQPGTGVVSVAKLKHKPVKAARKAFEKAVSKTQKGDSTAAITLLEQAVELDPDYMEAHNNLGARYLMSGQPERAIQHFQKAAELDPGSAAVYTNLSLALGNTRDFVGAEQAARRALDLNPAEGRARYMLGMSLFLQHKLNAETISILKQAQEIFPKAQIALAYAEAATGETVQARKTVKSYLQTNDKELRAEAENLLSRLEANPNH
jgi:Flp pilus assembly protein TadD